MFATITWQNPNRRGGKPPSHYRFCNRHSHQDATICTCRPVWSSGAWSKLGHRILQYHTPTADAHKTPTIQQAPLLAGHRPVASPLGRILSSQLPVRLPNPAPMREEEVHQITWQRPERERGTSSSQASLPVVESARPAMTLTPWLPLLGVSRYPSAFHRYLVALL